MGKLCVRSLEEGRREEEEEKADGSAQPKQEPHTMMWGMSSSK